MCPRKKPLALVILVPTAALSMLFPISQGDRNLPQLAHTLSDAYTNALMHETPNAELEAKDLLLESAAIRFSSRMLYEITQGSCQTAEDAAVKGSSVDGTCVLDDESVGLADLTDTLSSAAHRLEDLGFEDLGRAACVADGGNGKPTPAGARIGAMEHLYRMVFALSKVYLDRSQSGVYVEAAREQLGFARRDMETERSLCACDDSGYSARLLELSEIEDRLSDIRDEAARP